MVVLPAASSPTIRMPVSDCQSVAKNVQGKRIVSKENLNNRTTGRPPNDAAMRTIKPSPVAKPLEALQNGCFQETPGTR